MRGLKSGDTGAVCGSGSRSIRLSQVWDLRVGPGELTFPSPLKSGMRNISRQSVYFLGSESKHKVHRGWGTGRGQL